MNDTVERVRGTLIKPPSGWLTGCDYGREPNGSDRHYVILCVGGPLDGQYEVFHGEAPGMFTKPSGMPKYWWQRARGGDYYRVHECKDGNDAVFICTREWHTSMFFFWRHEVVWWIKRRLRRRRARVGI